MVQVSASRNRANAALAILALSSGYGLSAAPAQADAKLEAHYRVTLAGWQIGSGSWKVDLANGRYSMVANGQSNGLASVFAGGKGNASARGAVRGNRIIPSSYALTIRTARNLDQVRMGLASGAVSALAIEPPPNPSPNNVPLTEAHKRGVIDPFSAGLVPLSSASTIGPEVCRRTVAIFDGRQRFDLALSYKRMDKAHAEAGYSGPLVVCSVRYNPVGGHDHNKFATRFLRENRDIEISYAPIAGTRFAAVYRIGLPTTLGPAILEATRFEIANSGPKRRSAATATQQR